MTLAPSPDTRIVTDTVGEGILQSDQFQIRLGGLRVLRMEGLQFQGILWLAEQERKHTALDLTIHNLLRLYYP